MDHLRVLEAEHFGSAVKRRADSPDQGHQAWRLAHISYSSSIRVETTDEVETHNGCDDTQVRDRSRRQTLVLDLPDLVARQTGSAPDLFLTESTGETSCS
ncbi:MAG TPA: hypothetical protein VH371_01475 [Candidatus Limnocylindrales bacterium]